MNEHPSSTDVAAQARALFEQGQFEESRKLFAELAEQPETAADGYYGIGATMLALGDAKSAETAFLYAVANNPTHANALYRLGVLNELKGSQTNAASFYERALAANPRHAGARDKLGRPSPPRPFVAPPSAHEAKLLPGVTKRPPLSHSANDTQATESPFERAPGVSPGPLAAGLSAGAYGVYATLLQDKNPISQQTVQQMEALRRRVRPAITSYIDRILLTAVAVALIAFDWAFIRHQLADTSLALGIEWGIVAVALAAIVLLHLVFLIASTTITIDKGRLQIRRGVFNRKLENLELWRVADVALTANVAERVAGYGTIVFRVGRDEHLVSVSGIARGEELDDVYQRLLNLVFLLRSNPVVKGIIT